MTGKEANILKGHRSVRNVAIRVIRKIFADRKIDIEKIIFFGSRVRGDFTKESDWDFLIVARNDLQVEEKRTLFLQVKRKLAKMGIPNDIIIQPRKWFNMMKEQPGHISYTANLEGVTL